MDNFLTVFIELAVNITGFTGKNELKFSTSVCTGIANNLPLWGPYLVALIGKWRRLSRFSKNTYCLR